MKNQKQGVTIYKIANILNISPSTVSRALNSSGRMRMELRKKIFELAKKYNYIPNQMARGLRTKSSMLLGLVVPNIQNPYYVAIARGCQDEADRHDYSIAICNTDDKPELEKKRILALAQRQVDGLLLFNFFNHQETLELLEKLPIPSVLFNPLPKTSFPHIRHNTSDAIKALILHFLGKGYKTIAHIAGSQKTVAGKSRLRNFVQVLQAHQVPLREEWIVEDDFTFQGGCRAMKALLRLRERPQAVWASNDLMAIGAMEAIRGAGLRIPEDIAVAGCDDIEHASLVTPRLTTIAKPKYELGVEAVSLLVALIRGEEPQEKVLEDMLVIREST